MSNLPKYNGEGVYNFMRIHNYTSVEQLYLDYNNLKEPPKCIYCGEKCKFISFLCGYENFCNGLKHKNEFNKIGKETLKIKRQNYDNFIINNIDFYKNITFPFIDIYDNKEVKTLTDFKRKSFSKLSMFNEAKKCKICGNDFIINKFFKYTLKEHCNNKKCCLKFYTLKNQKDKNFYEEYLKFKDKISYENFKYCKKYKTDLEKFIEVYEKYNLETAKLFAQRNLIFYKNYILKRSGKNKNFSFLQNNIIEDDMKSICKNCGNEYIKFDKIISNNEIEYKKIGAEYSCSYECYKKCIKFYKSINSKEKYLKQSKSMKEKIKNGLFTPPVTNSWSSNKTKLIFDNILFRSS